MSYMWGRIAKTTQRNPGFLIAQSKITYNLLKLSDPSQAADNINVALRIYDFKYNRNNGIKKEIIFIILRRSEIKAILSFDSSLQTRMFSNDLFHEFRRLLNLIQVLYESIARESCLWDNTDWTITWFFFLWINLSHD